jgi:hypothetical protein
VQPLVSLSVVPCTGHRDDDRAASSDGRGRRDERRCVTHDRSPSTRADVAVGQPVSFSLAAQVPPGTGKIVGVEWDFVGTGTFPVRTDLRHSAPFVRLDATYTFAEPGTYFPVVRVTSQRDGDPNTPYTLIQNLGRVRVVVR